MNNTGLRDLLEAYSEVYTSQEVDEARKSDYTDDKLPSDEKLGYGFKDNKKRRKDLKTLERLIKHERGLRRGDPMYNSYEPEGEKIDESELGEGVDLFDYLLEYLVAEGYADTNKAAIAIMTNMSEEWKQDIVEGMTMKDFKERRRKLQRKAASDDAKKRGHVDKFTGKPYGTEEAASRRKDIHSPEHEPEREARRKFAEDPD